MTRGRRSLVTEVNGRQARPRGEPGDDLVARLRGLVADRMAQQAGRDGTMTAAARSRVGRALIREALEEEAEAALTSGRAPLDLYQQAPRPRGCHALLDRARKRAG